MSLQKPGASSSRVASLLERRTHQEALVVGHIHSRFLGGRKVFTPFHLHPLYVRIDRRASPSHMNNSCGTLTWTL